MSTANKLTYLNTTKQKIKQSINNLGGSITSDTTFRNYATELDSIYNKLPKVNDTGTDLNLSPTLEGRLGLIPRGNTEQDGTPTPDNPIMPKIVTGENNIKVENRNLFDGARENVYFASGNVFSGQSGALTTGFIEAKEGETFTISASSNTNGIVIASFDKNYNTIERSAISTASVIRPLTHTCPPNTAYIIGSNYLGMTMDTQLQKGSTTTDYVEHQEQNYPVSLGNIELVEIGNYADYIEGTPDNWIKKEVIRKVILNGIDGTYSKTTTNRFNIDGLINYRQATGNTDYLCNYYTGYSQTANNGAFDTLVSSKDSGFNLSSASYTIRFKDNRFDNISDFKNWIQTQYNNGTPVIIYYVLVTSTEVPITDTTLINQLNSLYYANSYDDETNISTTREDGNMPMKISASALMGGIV